MLNSLNKLFSLNLRLLRSRFDENSEYIKGMFNSNKSKRNKKSANNIVNYSEITTKSLVINDDLILGRENKK